MFEILSFGGKEISIPEERIFHYKSKHK